MRLAVFFKIRVPANPIKITQISSGFHFSVHPDSPGQPVAAGHVFQPERPKLFTVHKYMVAFLVVDAFQLVLCGFMAPLLFYNPMERLNFPLLEPKCTCREEDAGVKGARRSANLHFKVKNKQCRVITLIITPDSLLTLSNRNSSGIDYTFSQLEEKPALRARMGISSAIYLTSCLWFVENRDLKKRHKHGAHLHIC